MTGSAGVPPGHDHIAAATVNKNATHKHRRIVDTRTRHDDVAAVGINVAVIDVHGTAAIAHSRPLQRDDATRTVDGVIHNDTRIISIAMPDNCERA